MRLQIEDVCFCYGSHQVLDGVSADLPDGGFVGLIGPNGCGKSTLLRVIARVLRPQRGRVLIDGRDLASFKGRERARAVALVEQQSATRLDLTARQVVELGRIPHRGRWPSRAGEGAEALAHAASFANVEHLLHRPWHGLSGGERQRVQLARALAQEPEVLLLDEPTNHLDPGHQIDFLQRISNLGITTVAALHDLELALGFCDKVIVLDGGQLAVRGAPSEVITASLMDELYGVDADVIEHPRLPRRHLVWSGVSEGRQQ